jgi:hypothetical protein
VGTRVHSITPFVNPWILFIGEKGPYFLFSNLDSRPLPNVPHELGVRSSAIWSTYPTEEVFRTPAPERSGNGFRRPAPPQCVEMRLNRRRRHAERRRRALRSASHLRRGRGASFPDIFLAKMEVRAMMFGNEDFAQSREQGKRARDHRPQPDTRAKTEEIFFV